MSVNSHFLNLDTDVTLSSNSDTIIPSQKAIKTYADNKLIFFGTSTTAKATAQKEVSIPSITSLETGTIIVVQPTITSTVANSTIKLNNFDAYPMLYNNAAITTDTDSVVWNANYPCMWVFDGSNWRLVAKGLDSNSTYNMDYLNDQGPIKIGGTSTDTQALSRYSLVMQLPDMSWQKITNTTEAYSTGTSKTVNTNGFLLPTIKYYNTTTIVVGGGTTASRTIRPYSSNVDLRYSTNCGDTPGWTLGDYIYLVGTISNGLFYLDTTTWWTNTLPSTNDGKYYIRVGVVVSDYSCSLLLEHPVYYYDGTKLCTYQVGDNKLDVSTAANIYLPLTGGTLTGDLFIQGADNKLFGFKRTNSDTNIDIGWDWDAKDGSGAAFRSSGAASNAGGFYIFARNSAGTTVQLIGTPGGSLTWGGSELLRVNKIDNSTIKANSSNVISVNQDALNFIPKNYSGSVSNGSETAPIDPVIYGPSARPKGIFRSFNLLQASENRLYGADRGVKTGVPATITCTHSAIGENMFDGSYSGYFTSINPSTDFSAQNPFVFEVTCTTKFDITETSSLYLVGHRTVYDLKATAYKLEVAYAYNSTDGFSWGTLIDYSGEAVSILNKYYSLYYSGHGGSNTYHNIFGIRLTITGSTSTVFAMCEMMLLSTFGTERISNSFNSLDVRAGGKVTGDITIPTEYGAFKGLHKGNVESDQVKITGNHTFTNQISNSNNDLVVKVNNENFVVCEYNNTDKTIRPSNTSKGILDLGLSTNKYNNVYANTFNGNLTGNVTGDVTGTASKATADASGNTITTTYATKSELSSKQDTIIGGASSIVSNNFTANRVVISNSNGKAASSSVTSTELGYLSGVTSSIQTQLGDKQPKTLDTAITVDGTTQTTVEGALGAINTLAESKVEYAMVIKEW